MKTSQHQFDLMVTFMEEHGDLTKPSSSSRGRLATIHHWRKLTSLLNSDGSGDTKTTEKWKKVWSDFKNNTKKKAARLHRAARGTGGGPAVNTKLSELEQKVLNLIGVQAATGLAIAEAGIPQDIIVSPSLPEQPEHDTYPNPIVEIILDEPGPSSQLHTAVRPVFSPPLMLVHEEPIESTVNAQSQTPNVAAPLQPALSGQTSPRRTERSSRTRLTFSDRQSPRRRARPQVRQTEQAAEQFLHSDAEWRSFRMQQHENYMELKREQNRIREMELQTQREWQAVGLRTIDLLEKVVNKFCRDQQ